MKEAHHSFFAQLFKKDRGENEDVDFCFHFVSCVIGEILPEGVESSDGPAGWMNGWTIFYWGWWIAWSPFVGEKIVVFIFIVVVAVVVSVVVVGVLPY